MKSVFIILFILSTIILFQNCSSRHEELNGQASGSSFADPNNPISVAAFEKTLYPFLTAQGRCVSCHASSQQPLHSQLIAAFSHDVISSFSLVNLQTPSESRLVTKVRGGHQGFGSTEANQIENAILAWANEILLHGGTLGANANVLQEKYSSIKNLILNPKCLSCHSPSGTSPNTDFSNYETTVNTGGVVPFNADASAMFTQCQSGQMPQGSTPLSAAEKSSIRNWIENGALND